MVSSSRNIGSEYSNILTPSYYCIITLKNTFLFCIKTKNLIQKVISWYFLSLFMVKTHLALGDKIFVWTVFCQNFWKIRQGIRDCRYVSYTNIKEATVPLNLFFSAHTFLIVLYSVGGGIILAYGIVICLLCSVFWNITKKWLACHLWILCLNWCGGCK